MYKCMCMRVNQIGRLCLVPSAFLDDWVAGELTCQAHEMQGQLVYTGLGPGQQCTYPLHNTANTAPRRTPPHCTALHRTSHHITSHRITSQHSTAQHMEHNATHHSTPAHPSATPQAHLVIIILQVLRHPRRVHLPACAVGAAIVSPLECEVLAAYLLVKGPVPAEPEGPGHRGPQVAACAMDNHLGG